MPPEDSRLSPVPRKENTSSWEDKWLFLIMLALGVMGMFVLWGVDVPQLYVTAWPVTCLLGYAAFLGFSKRYQIREDRAGDNLYYLGFLYTLVSLGHALWVFTDKEDGAGQIIVDFGIALATTILGLALRVVFNQLREDPVEAERQIRLELNRSVRDLVDDMSKMRMAVTGYTKQIEQSIEEVHFESRKAVEENIQNTTESYKQVVSDLDTQIRASYSRLDTSTGELATTISGAREAVEGLEQRISEVRLEPELFERVLRESVEPITSAAQEFRGKILNIRFDPDLIERAITRPFENFSEELDHLRDLHLRQTNMIESLSSTIDEAAKGVGGVSVALGEISRLKLPEDAISNAIEPAYRQLNAYLHGLQSQSEADKGRLEALSDTVNGLTTQIANLDGAFTSVLGVGDAISSMHSGFSEIADSMKETTTEVASAISKHTELVQSLNLDVQETADRLRNYRSEMDSELDAVRQANQKVFSDLAQLAETVVNRLQRDS